MRPERRATGLLLFAICACNGGSELPGPDDAYGIDPPVVPDRIPTDSGSFDREYHLQSLTIGNTQACGIRDNGWPICWGATEAEIELGTDDFYYSDGVAPTGVALARVHFSGLSRIAEPKNSASGRVCAVFEDPVISCCWGRTTRYEGRYTCHTREEVSTYSDPFAQVVSLTVADCYLHTSGRLWCWDDQNQWDLALNVAEISTAHRTLYALHHDGSLSSWLMLSDECETNAPNDLSRETLSADITNPSLVEGADACLWDRDDGQIRCLNPAFNRDAGPGVAQVVGLGGVTCARYETGEVRCEAPEGCCDLQNPKPETGPFQPDGLFKHIALWPDSATVGCGVTLDGEARCWGAPGGQATRIVTDVPSWDR
jgi:hypothetical protein